MGGRCIGLGGIAAFTTLVMSGGARAQPAEPKDPGDSKSAPESTGSDNQPAASPPASPAKDPKLAKKWLLAGQQLMQKASFLAANNRSEEAKAQFANAVA